MSPPVRIALIVGCGTGPQLADIFENFITRIAERANLSIQISRSHRTFHSYTSLLAADDCDIDKTSETINDATYLQKFLQDEYAVGTRLAFRTAISAQALYMVRENLQAIKVEVFEKGKEASLLLVRDQAQGFYSGSSLLLDGGKEIQRTCHFRQETFLAMIRYACDRAQKLWGVIPEKILMVYKFHLFDGLFFTWAERWTDETGMKIEFVQPDTMNRNILAFGLPRRCVIIAANEFADTMEPFFIDMFGKSCLNVQETAFGENVFLDARVHGMVEYQTVHGSADDLTGKDLVNPLATVRAAADMASRIIGNINCAKAVDRILQYLINRGLATPDQSGTLSTTELTRLTLRLIERVNLHKLDEPDLRLNEIDCGFAPLFPKNPTALRNGNHASRISRTLAAAPCHRSALVVMDFQNDFIAIGEAQGMQQIVVNIQKVVEKARGSGLEVIFVRFLGDRQHQGPSWRARNVEQHRRDICLTNSWGIEIFGAIKPLPSELVFDKRSVFDAFLNRDFADHIEARGLRELMFVGVYADICIDSTARTAFQRGLFVSIVEDCAPTMHIPQHVMLSFMQKVYGAHIIKTADYVRPEGDLVALHASGSG